MATSNEFIRAWYNWRRAATPRIKSDANLLPFAKVIHDLEHMSSYVYSVGLNAISGVTSDYANIARREIADLDRIESLLGNCSITATEKKEFTEYICVVRRLLEEIGNVSK
jgi:hypothetical protein